MSIVSDCRAKDETLHSRFECIAAASPNRVAAAAGGKTLTYRELNEQSNRIAWRLRELGVGPGSIVGLSVDRSIDMLAGLLGILKAGGAYVPLDPGYPQGRLKLMLDDSSVTIVVTQEHLGSRLPGGDFNLLTLDDASAFASYPSTNPPGGSSAQDTAYVIYTSGSTGNPKGVLATHGNVANLVRDQSYLEITPDDRVAAIASLTFDASTFEIWGALLNGASCYVYDFADGNLPALFAAVESDEISILALTSPIFRILEPGHFKLARRVRAMLFGGDSVRTEIVARASEAFAGELIHVYGPTETTSFATVLKAGVPTGDSSLFPIGYPIRGVSVRAIRSDGERAIPGDEGELYIGGNGVAMGYLNQPELTQERFSQDESGEGGLRFYRTGDLVRVGPSGELHFLGRLDRQLKIRGHRIEPAEIESALTQHPGVSDAVVIGRSDGAGDKRLHAYLVRARPTGGDAPPAGRQGQGPAESRVQPQVSDYELVAGIRQRVAQVLPIQQCPATYTIIESIPLTSNMKLDEASLPAPREPERAPNHVSVKPSKPVEVELTNLWKSKLDVNDVGIDDDFFELGGDSMMAFQIAALAEKTLGLGFGVRTMFKYPTIRKLSAALAAGEADEVSGTANS